MNESRATVSIRTWSELDEAEQKRILSRSETNIEALIPETQQLVNRVRSEGDSVLVELSRAHDGATISSGQLRVSDEEFAHARRDLSPKIVETLEYVVENVRRFHAHQVHSSMHMVEVRPGVLAGERTTPIQSVGIYVPRGRGSFPSMLYMAAVPALLAGVPRVAVFTPCLADGSVDPACLVAAQMCGVTEVYRVGGPGAVAAMAYGTESIRSVYKILGPGSARVTAAKRVVSMHVDVGLPAGPTESMIIADRDADPFRLGLDLITEAEHGADSQALLLTPSRPVAEAVAEIVAELLVGLPESRRNFVQAVLSDLGGIVLTDSIDEACEIANDFAPEHLMLQTRDPWHTLSSIKNAGEILLGPHTPFSVANYATGANAILPTGGWAKSWGSVCVDDFTKRSSVIQVSQAGLAEPARHTATLADYEQFAAHAAAVRLRQTDMHHTPR